MLLVNGCETFQTQAEVKKLIIEEKGEERVEEKKPISKKKPIAKKSR